MWPLLATTVAYAMNTFASEAFSSFSPFQLVFLRDPPDLTSLSESNFETPVMLSQGLTTRCHYCFKIHHYYVLNML